MYLGCEFPPSNDDNYNNPKPQEKNKSQIVSQFFHSFSPVEIGKNNQLNPSKKSPENLGVEVMGVEKKHDLVTIFGVTIGSCVTKKGQNQDQPKPQASEELSSATF